MSATSPTAPGRTTRTGPLVGAGVAAALLAGAATAAVAAGGTAAGVSLDVGGAPIPVLGFAAVTVFFALVGLVLAVVLSRRARRPRRTFVVTTGVLTVLSLGPDLIADAAPATKALLMLTHLVAAAIVVPTVGRFLGEHAAETRLSSAGRIRR